ncbi:M56 family metallopeptidase [Paenibacillus radicis (ex Xue et al. 2023)]|uniref:M56 family metallopeptidase n=1 Tax=Paenibacillus radicis (ex Xue et al. 2023) TaxID=2972489 RepID=A0ABT1YPW7_9BACL|nr:M56 family metallopeptidase [Paenibacillus radicis (ex Xue et al. 2023)]MCR8635215.1 M56 family metallopeptidase [Paenibacillus radicis (ex Xue et al. 2023)]
MIRFERPQISMLLIILISGLVLLQMGLSLSHQLGDVPFGQNTLGYLAELISDIWVNHSVFEMLFFLLICFTVYRMLQYIAKQSYLAMKWNLFIKGQVHGKLTKRWNNKFRTWDETILVLRESSPLAFAVGFMRPKIVISTGLLDLLSPEEVKAVLLHERYHCQFRHPLKKWITGLFIKSMEYVPVIKSLGAHFEIWIELQADRYVMKKTNSPLILGSALIKLIKVHNKFQMVRVSFAEHAINYRLQQIIDPDKPIAATLFTGRCVFISSAVMLVMSMIVMFQCV